MSEPDFVETLIVGGSLAGLTTAIALAARGRPVTVLERTQGRTQRGVAIGLGRTDLDLAVGTELSARVIEHLGEDSLRQGPYPHPWWNVYTALRTTAEELPGITLIDGADVTEVGEDDESAWAVTGDGRRFTARVLIGADGYRSVIRRHVAAHHPYANYAGYIVWLGQSDFPPGVDGKKYRVDFESGGPELLALYPMVQGDGTIPRYGWAWFDAGHNDLLREIGAIDGDEVLHTPRATAIPDEVYATMERRARKWSEPWRTGLKKAFAEHDVIATPITEYIADTVVTGRVAIIGDAAHAQSPMTGAGYYEACADAASIADAIGGDLGKPAMALTGNDPDEVRVALRRYEAQRLQPMRRKVQGGMSFASMLG
ncbi:NAD(P)/FAD-dependent oxidoreductase [Tsukamurella sp. NPDC003166]|uniref:NAD(P)/FAD-dependent oxidoreductase n=1 Tax=Tsukamurella sp. NPDC003166 TaxID=3154444 RepID=UPI0033AEE4A4